MTEPTEIKSELWAEFEKEDLERQAIANSSFSRTDLKPNDSLLNNVAENADFDRHWGVPPHEPTDDERIEQLGWTQELHEQKLQELYKAGDPGTTLLFKKRAFRRRFAIINYSGKTFVHNRNTKGELEFQDFKSFREFYRNEWVEFEDATKKPPRMRKVFIADEFLMDKHAKKYQGIEFSPGQTTSEYLNLWKGWSVTPVAGPVDLFLELVRSLTDYDESATEYILNYLAHIFQVPEKKPETAIVMRSRSHGVGKGSLMKLLSRLTENYAHLTSSQSLGGTFSGHLMDKIIAFLDENTWAPGDKAIEGRIKALVTEPVIGIRMMRKDEIQVKSYLRIFIASNEDFPVAIAGEDRRFFVVDCSDKYKGQTNPGEFFWKFNKWIEEGGDAAVMHYLMNRDISQFNPRTFPKTKARLDIQMLSLPPAQRFIYEVLNGTGPMSEDTLTIDGIRYRFKRNALYADMVEWCKTIRAFPPSTDEFGKTISRLLDFAADQDTWKTSWSKKVGGKNEYFYQLKSLAIAQERFARNTLGTTADEIFFSYGQNKEDEQKSLAASELIKRD